MSYASEISRKLNTGSGTVTAVIYARVSTENEGQKDSCANQVEMALNYIRQHPNITLKGTYVDDGISGKNDFTRPQYTAMRAKIETEHIDLIITKALSRLNRDQLNSLELRSFLVEHKTTVFTLEDLSIQDFEDFNSEFMHSFKYLIDAQFVQQQSLNGRKTQQLRCERKELSSKDVCFGYDWNPGTKTITINEEQAETVRWIFEEFVFHNGVPATIHNQLHEKGIELCEKTVSNIIRREKYIGKFYINQRSTTLGTGKKKSKRYRLPKEQWVLVERQDLVIVDPDIFAMAQRIHKARQTVFGKPEKPNGQPHYIGRHKYAGKIYCSECHKSYIHAFADRAHTKDIYRLCNHSSCSTPDRVYESDLDAIISHALKTILTEQTSVFANLEKVLVECVTASQNNKSKITDMQKQRKQLQKKIDALIETMAEGGLTEESKELIKIKMNTLSEKVTRLSEEIVNTQASQLDDSYVDTKLAEIRTAISKLKNFTVIDRDRILNYIDKIIVLPRGDLEILLKTGHVITATKQPINQDFSNTKDVVKIGRRDVRY
ncbi:hypothetical protein CXIVA_07930 [Clostridium sp. SY8519]|uniref:recombinase family protein n=1 Tax=Clostridium sp. (strain SY8519) TaxID=1042156 RepID=UPI0002172035|nr:recombinase family protein [Clostridium sp. SY8519]BAK46760.1 hypothetical protein CXIVA_07930 [Clostridium sp. SY8519]